MTANLDFEIPAIPSQGAEDELLTRLGQRLRRARERRGMSASQFALHARVDRAALDAIERGDSDAGAASLIRIMTTLGIVDRLDLLEGAVSNAVRRRQPVMPVVDPGSPDDEFRPTSCRKFREGLCQEVFVYQAFRAFFGD
jgi:transcriptional regulator with XRE-family HTH domain